MNTLDRVVNELRELRRRHSESDWPEKSLQALSDADVLRWTIPAVYGGLDVSDAELVQGYVALSEACLLTTFILTQRNGAIQRLASTENERVRALWLPRLCTHACFATVGISHLTTSRQHWRRPAVHAELTTDGVVLSGEVPWVTGAAHAEVIVTGATCDDGRQLLVALPTALPGVEVQPHADLLALTGSHTGPVRLKDVRLSAENVIAGPVERVMQRGKGGGTGSLTTSALAVGHAAQAVAFLLEEAERREDLRAIAEAFRRELQSVQNDLLDAAGDPGSPHTAESLRTRANSLVLRATQAMLAAAKGAGFVKGHPAERAVREAMFFLVWSCPQPVVRAALQEFACVGEDESFLP